MARFDLNFLENLEKYYKERLWNARQKGFDDPATQYHWLYKELAVRVETIEQVTLFMSLLPKYLQCSDTESTMDFAARYVEAWFTEKVVGKMPHNANGQSVYFSPENPYWVDVEKAGADVSADADENVILAQIGEYVICCLRLFFYVREHQFRPVDRAKFDRLMSASSDMKA